MDNRRQPENPSTKSYNRSKSYSDSGGKNYGFNNYRPKDKSFQKKDNNRYPPRGERDNRYQDRDNRFQDRENRYPDREKRFQDRDNRYQDRDNRFQNRDNRFQGRGERNERYQGRDNNSGFRPRDNQRDNQRDNRFQNRDNRYGKPNDKYNNRNNKFQGKKGFFPKGKPSKPWENDNRPRIVSDMQVTEGKHRGKYLTSSPSPKVKTTARRLREVMFRILYRKIRAKRFLDLCAGAGMVGIEAMSRGALLGTFVERSARMCSYIRKNMAVCEIKEGHGEIFETEVVPFLKEMKKRKRCWDVVYFDPPYDADYEEVLKYLSRGVALEMGGVLVIEHHAEMFFPEKINQLKRWRVIVQGDSALSFFERR